MTKGEKTMTTTIETTYKKAYLLAVMLESWKAGSAPKKVDLLESACALLTENELSEIVPGKGLSNLLDIAECINSEDREGLRNWLFDNLTSGEKLDLSISREYSAHVLCG